MLLDSPTNTFRGDCVPRDTDGLFASYTASLRHYADVAQALQVTPFYVGSENENLARNTLK